MRLYRAYFEMVRRRVGSPTERLRCHGHLPRWSGVNWNALRLAREALGAVEPRALVLALRVNRRLFGSVLPSHDASSPTRGRLGDAGPGAAAGERPPRPRPAGDRADADLRKPPPRR